MPRSLHMLVLALATTLASASSAAAFTAETALRADRQISQLRVTDFAAQAREAHQQTALRYGKNASDSSLASRALPQVAGRGSTAALSKGTTAARNLREQLAIEQAMRNPAAGRALDLKMTDPRWPASEGWVKMQQMVQSGGREGPINVHYLLNTATGAIDDFKIVLQGAR
jgi:hypothetical protein